VNSDDDDEGLTWAGGRDPSHYETPEVKAPKPSKAPKAAAAKGKPASGEPEFEAPESETPESETPDDDESELAPGTSSVMLVALGLLGGIYLLYTIGWFISWQREVYVDPDALELAAFRIQQVLGIIAAPLWFVMTILLTRRRRPAVRLLWLVIGALLLVPWSFTFGR
jgi:hypothetical protein